MSAAEESGELRLTDDIVSGGPTGPFSTLHPDIDPDQLDMEDLSNDLEPLEDSVKMRAPTGPEPKLTMPATGFSLGFLPPAEELPIEWRDDVASSSSSVAALEATRETSQGMPAISRMQVETAPSAPAMTEIPPAFEAPMAVIPAPAAPFSSAPPAPIDIEVFVAAPTLGMDAPPPPPVAPISPFVLVADVAPPAPPMPVSASFVPPMPVSASFAPPMPVASQTIAPQAFFPEPVRPSQFEEFSLPITRVIPEHTSPAVPVLAPVSDPFADEDVVAPRRGSGGLIAGLAVGLLLAAALAAGGYMFFLRERPGSLVFRAPADATVTVDQLPVQGVSGLYIIRDLKPGAHALTVTRPGAAPWAQAVTVPAGGSVQLEAPGAADSAPTQVAAQPVFSQVAPTQPAPTQPAAPAAPIALSALPAPAPEAAPVPAPEPVRPVATTATPAPHRTTDAPRSTATANAASRATAPEASNGRTGFISINTSPFAQVQVDGRTLGNTPLVRHELRAGPHTVTLMVPAWNIRSSRRISITAGETSVITVRFQEPGRAATGPTGPTGNAPTGPTGNAPMGPAGNAPMGGPSAPQMR